MLKSQGVLVVMVGPPLKMNVEKLGTNVTTLIILLWTIYLLLYGFMLFLESTKHFDCLMH